MTKASLIAITTALWGAGFAIAAGLAYEIGRPLPPVTTRAAEPVPVTLQTTTATPQDVHVVVLPELEVRATVSSVPQSAPKKEARCSDWQPLLQGSGSVQICE